MLEIEIRFKNNLEFQITFHLTYLYVSPDSVVPGKCPRTIGAGYPYTLMALSYVGSEISLISVSSLTEWASHFCA